MPENKPTLAELTTMRLGGPAKDIVAIYSKDELTQVVKNLLVSDSKFIVLGGGSNVIARDEGFDGTIILNKIPGFDVLDEDELSSSICVGAGENWDNVVGRSTQMGLSGIEAMSAIPGTAGATPVQNVGAYGQEIADTLVELEAFDTHSSEFVTLKKDDCQFTYRNSIFKNPTTRHHIITSITLRLSKKHMQPPFYASLEKYLDDHGISDYSPVSIREAVRAIRARKLPDPSVVANTGSFFKNPIVSSDTARALAEKYSNLPQFNMPDGRVKLAAGWLIEAAGLKGYRANGFRTSDDNALVVINEAASSYEQLLKFRAHIIEVVQDKFGVTLEQEPETL